MKVTATGMKPKACKPSNIPLYYYDIFLALQSIKRVFYDHEINISFTSELCMYVL